MENSVLSSHLGSQLQQSVFQEDQVLREFHVSQPTQPKTNKIAVALTKLQKLYAELTIIQQQKQLTQDKILLAFEKGLRMVGNVDGKEFLEKGRELFQLCQVLAFQFDQQEGYQPKQIKVEEKEKKEEKKEKEEKIEVKKKVFRQQEKEQLKTNCKLKQKKQQLEKVQEKVLEKVEQPSPKTLKKQQNKPKEQQQAALKSNKQPQKEKIEPKPEKPIEKKIQQKQQAKPNSQPKSRDELDQELKSVVQDILINESQIISQSQHEQHEQHEDLTFPIVWEEKQGIQVKHRVAKKESPTEYYEKICAKQSFKMGGTYRIKFRVKKYGTMAIGLVSSQYKANKYIDDRKNPTALKYIAFQNGGGKITLCGVERGNGYHIGLQNNKTLEMVFDSAKMTVTFVSERLGSYKIELPEIFKEYPLYLFLEMKQKDTCIQFL